MLNGKYLPEKHADSPDEIIFINKDIMTESLEALLKEFKNSIRDLEALKDMARHPSPTASGTALYFTLKTMQLMGNELSSQETASLNFVDKCTLYGGLLGGLGNISLQFLSVNLSDYKHQ